MNRPGIGPQPMRGIPGPYANQQQLSQSRSSSGAGRLPNNKMASNVASWGFPNGGPVSGGQSARLNLAPTTSFASIGAGSQPPTPLDLSDFPTLSTNNNSQQASGNPIPQSLWASSNARNLAQPSGQRPGQSNLILGHQNQAHHQSQQDDLFNSSSQLPSNQGIFRFGNQNPVGQSAISQQGRADEFPPLNQTGNGDIGHSVLQMSNSIYAGTVGSAFSPGIGGTQQTNGLLNQLSNSRAPSAGRTGSPANLQALLAANRLPDMKSRASGTMDNDIGAFSRPAQPPSQNTFRDQLGQQSGNGPPILQNQVHNELFRAFGGDAQGQEAALRTRDFSGQTAVSENNGEAIEDPCAGMSDMDRFGVKGLISIINGPYRDQALLARGTDVASSGLDLNTSDRISEQLWSVFDDQPSRPEEPAPGTYEIPECYIVHNVASVDNKIQNFSDETLFLLFYQNPGDIQQIEAARELANRNWRYHKKAGMWLTKDLTVQPIQLNSTTERGYYVFWNHKVWERQRHEMTLNYADLEIHD